MVKLIISCVIFHDLKKEMTGVTRGPAYLVNIN
jgi:hypothetical protein